ncbi:hypothetical protein CRG98_013282 [Punica granatum]|uniref:Uncharacterized protein n=1 Tax=Punica granatum TaxID=22663 RepID=A0A2I0KDJ7_PUNGR|nr:hypothetical protein CRG98_013282 [Punica granatum]
MRAPTRVHIRVRTSITKEDIIEPLKIEIAKGPAHCGVIEATDGKPWYEDIKQFLQTGQCLAFANRHDWKTLRRLAAARRFTVAPLTPHYSGVSKKMRHNVAWKKCTRGAADPT